MGQVVMMPARGPVGEVVEEAREMGFERVVVVGWKDGKVYLSSSGAENRLEWMGVLVGALIELWMEGEEE